MNQFLVIESSRACCSVALAHGDSVLEKQESGFRSHTQHMMPFIDEVLQEAGIDVTDLEGIAFSAGPGSFTGIRLAASVAKSLAYAANKPVIPFSSLELLFKFFLGLPDGGKENQVLVISDARMSEVFMAAYTRVDNKWHTEISDQLVSLEDLRRLDFKPDIIVSDALPDGFEDALFSGIPRRVLSPVASDAVPLVKELWHKGAITTALQAEPVYLRDKTGWKNTKQQKQLKT